MVNHLASRRSRRSACALWMLLSLAGCRSDDVPLLDEQALHGAVDTQLPPAQRAEQEALYRGLELLRQGVHIDDLSQAHPDLRWQESESEFFAGGARLIRWNWTAPPKPGRHQVKLVLQKDQPGMVTIELERTYQVAAKGDEFIVDPQH